MPLDNDTLDIAFSYLRIGELAIVLRVCKWWKDVASALSEGITMFVSTGNVLESVGNRTTPLHSRITGVFSDGAMRPDSLYHLRRLPRLTLLDATIDYSGANDHGGRAHRRHLDHLMSVLPRGLTTLCMRERLDSPTLTGNALVLDALPALTNLETLDLTALFRGVDGGGRGDLDLLPLLHLPRLEYLELGSMPLTLDRAVVLGKLVRLQSLRCKRSQWSVEVLTALCGQAGGLQHLEVLDLDRTCLTAEHMEALIRLRSIKIIQPEFIHLEAIPYLPRFPVLCLVLLNNTEALYPDIASEQYLAAFRSCPALTELRMDPVAGDEVGPDRVPRLLVPSVPRLKTLILTGCSISSFDFLQHLKELEKLILWGGAVASSEVMKLGEFAPQLTELDVQSCRVPFTAADLQQLILPSRLLPKLRLFKYGDPEDEDEDDENEDE